MFNYGSDYMLDVKLNSLQTKKAIKCGVCGASVDVSVCRSVCRLAQLVQLKATYILAKHLCIFIWCLVGMQACW